MESFFSRYKNPLVLVIVLSVQFVVLAVQVRSNTNSTAHAVDQAGVRAIRLGVSTVITPPESVLHSGGRGLRGIWADYIGLVGLKQKNDQLTEQVQRLQLEQAALAEDARQGQRLEELLAFKQNYIYSTVPAQVVGGSGTDRSRVLFLDKGSDDGIAVEMPVITPDGIVGKIREVFPHSSQVLVISDPTSAFGALLEDTRTRGVVKGNAAGQPQIVNLMPDDRIKPGQKVVTSGGDQIFPRGLPVGTVEHIQTDPENEPMVDVVLKPAANLSRLEEVLVVTSNAPAPPPKVKEDLAQSQSVAAGIAAAKKAAEEAAAAKAQQALDAQRASDVLAQRLPGKNDDTANPDAPDATADASPTTEAEGAKPLHPPSALHPDHYTPLTVPPADSLHPGERYAPLAEGTIEPAKPVKKAAPAATGDGATAAASAATGPGTPGPGTPGSGTPASSAAGSSTPAAPRRMITTTLPDGTVVTRPAPAPSTRTVTTTLPDGTVVTRTMPVRPPGSATAPGGSIGSGANASGAAGSSAPTSGTAPRRMITTTLADGTVVTRPAPVPTTRIVTTTLADGTVVTRRVPVQPAAAVGGAPAAPATRRIVLPDGSVVTRPAPATAAATGAGTGASSASGTATTPAPRPMVRTTLPDGTVVTRPATPRPTTAVPGTSKGASTSAGTATSRNVPSPSSPGASAARTPATGTVTGTGSATSSAPRRTITTTLPDGTLVTRPAPAAGPRSTAPAATPRPATTAAPASSAPRIVTDGPLPAARPAVKPQAAKPPSATQAAPGGAAAPAARPPVKRKTPELVPDDGSRPPAPTPQGRS